MLLALKDIIEICFAPHVNEGILFDLEDLIAEHKRLYLTNTDELGHTLKLRPKHHFLDHYVKLFRCYGPLVQCNNIRNEAKHKSIKRVTKTCMNFRNILKTVAVRHQLQEALHNQSQSFLGDHGIECGAESERCIDLMESTLQHLLKPVSSEGFISQVSKVTVMGMDYFPGLAVVIGVDYIVPSFAIIEIIVVFKWEIFFLVRKVNSTYNVEKHLYELSDLPQNIHIPGNMRYSLTRPEDLISYYPLAVYPLGTVGAVSLKQAIVEVEK